MRRKYIIWLILNILSQLGVAQGIKNHRMLVSDQNSTNLFNIHTILNISLKKITTKKSEKLISEIKAKEIEIKELTATRNIDKAKKNDRIRILNDEKESLTKKFNKYRNFIRQSDRLIRSLKTIYKSLKIAVDHIEEIQEVNGLMRNIVSMIKTNIHNEGKNIKMHGIRKKISQLLQVKNTAAHKMQVSLRIVRRDTEDKIKWQKIQEERRNIESYKIILGIFSEKKLIEKSLLDIKTFKIQWRKAKKEIGGREFMRIMKNDIIKQTSSNISLIRSLIKKTDRRFFNILNAFIYQKKRNNEINVELVKKSGIMENKILNDLDIMKKVLNNRKQSAKNDKTERGVRANEGEEINLDSYKLINCQVFGKTFLGFSKKEGVNLNRRFDDQYKFEVFEIQEENIDNEEKKLGKFNPFFGLSSLKKQNYISVVPQYNDNDLKSLTVFVQVNEKIKHKNPKIEKKYFFFRSFITQRTCSTLIIPSNFQISRKRKGNSYDKSSNNLTSGRMRILEFSREKEQEEKIVNFNSQLNNIGDSIDEDGNIVQDQLDNVIDQKNLQQMVYNMTQPSIQSIQGAAHDTSNSFSSNLHGFSYEDNESMDHLVEYFEKSEQHSFETSVLDSDPEKGFVVFSGDFNTN